MSFRKLSKIIWVKKNFNQNFFIFIRSEGSLTQHIKLKHPDYFSKMGLTELNLKHLNDSKSINESDFKSNTSVKNNEEDNKNKDLDEKKVDNPGKTVKDPTKNNSLSNNVSLILLLFKKI